MANAVVGVVSTHPSLGGVCDGSRSQAAASSAETVAPRGPRELASSRCKISPYEGWSPGAREQGRQIPSLSRAKAASGFHLDTIHLGGRRLPADGVGTRHLLSASVRCRWYALNGSRGPAGILHTTPRVPRSVPGGKSVHIERRSQELCRGWPLPGGDPSPRRSLQSLPG